jgi:HPt (histidine-containing phosphotransfer) domain-containing protein
LAEFLQDIPHRIAVLQQALDSRNLRQVQRQAHTLKGAAGNVGTTALQAAAFSLEKAAAADDPARAALLLEKVDDQFEVLKKTLTGDPICGY